MKIGAPWSRVLPDAPLIGGRRSVLIGVAGSVGAVIASTGGIPAAAEAVSEDSRGTNVRSTGAVGDGVSDDTAAIRAAIVAAAGEEVYFPAGTYVIDALQVDGKTHFQLDPAATLLAKPNSPTGYMIAFTGKEFAIQGGSIDGNRSRQSGRPVIIAGGLQEGKVMRITGMVFTGTVKAAIYVTEFGGFLEVDNCTFVDQAEHTGEFNVGLSAIAYIVTGQVGSKGHFKFNDNRCLGTTTPIAPGSNPGGILISPASTSAPLVGNMTTLEATGNYFRGYGQNRSGNGISAIHLYHSTMGVRVTGNYFEDCSLSAISAKSVTDFVCIGNVFVGGALSSQNAASEGVISYVPGYNAGSEVQPRAVIASNIIDNPGGQSPSLLQNAISIHGTATSIGEDVVVTNNVIKGGGVGIQVVYVDGITIDGNVIDNNRGAGIQLDFVANAALTNNAIQGNSGGAPGSQPGIAMTQVTGSLTVSANVVKSQNGHGLIGLTGVNNSRINIASNRFSHAAPGYYAVVIRGAAFLKLTGNEVNATAGGALDVRADAAGNKVLHLAYDLSNTIVAGSVTFMWSQIVAATGQLRAITTPLGNVSPGEVGTTYHQSDGGTESVMWIAQGTTSSSWVRILSASTSNLAAANRLLGIAYDPVSAGAVVEATPSGVLNLTKIILTAGGAISRVLFHVSQAGTGLLAAQCWLGIYSASGALIGQSADLGAVLASPGTKSVPLVAPTGMQPAGTQVLVALVWNGESGPQLRGIAGDGIPNIGISAPADCRFSTAGNGLSTLPPTRPSGLAATAAPWMGVA